MSPRLLFLALAAASAPFLQDEEAASLTEEAFRICDLDGNRWISLSEAEATLGMSRAEYSSFDANNDGRVVLSEFQANAEAVVGRLGFAPSEALRGVDPKADVTVTSTEELLTELLALYDIDRSRGLSGNELERLLLAYEVDVSYQQLLAQADLDDSDQLEIGELTPLVKLVSEPEFDSGSSSRLTFRPPPPSIRFVGSTTIPPPAEVGFFVRLDANGDAVIDADDLRTLGEGGRIPVRPGAVVSALDRDGNGRIDPDEFWTSMGAR